MTVKSSISLTDEQDAFARTLVNSGRYPSVSAVMQQGLRLLRERIETEEGERAALRELLDRRRAGGFLPAEEFAAGVEEMIAAARGARKG